jgi:hypothetical protein
MHVELKHFAQAPLVFLTDIKEDNAPTLCLQDVSHDMSVNIG